MGIEFGYSDLLFNAGSVMMECSPLAASFKSGEAVTSLTPAAMLKMGMLTAGKSAAAYMRWFDRQHDMPNINRYLHNQRSVTRWPLCRDAMITNFGSTLLS